MQELVQVAVLVHSKTRLVVHSRVPIALRCDASVDLEGLTLQVAIARVPLMSLGTATSSFPCPCPQIVQSHKPGQRQPA